MNRHQLLVAVGIAALLLTASCATRSPSPTPSSPAGVSALNAPFFERSDVAYWQGRFETESREIFDRRHEIVRTVGLRDGQSVADIGTGTGFYAELFAHEVGPKGRVYAEDVVPAFVDNVRRRAAETGLPIEGVLGTFTDVSLPRQSIDLAFICDTYHHFDDAPTVLRSVHRALRPNGELVVIDFQRIPGVSRPWLLGHVRADQATFTDEIERSGFRQIDQPRYLGENYFLRFRKVGD